MVNNRRKRNSRRPRRSGMRSVLRRVQQAVTQHAVVSSIPSDPPPIKIGRVYQTVCDFQIVANKTTSSVTFKKLPQLNVILVKESAAGYEPFKVTEDTMYRAFLWGLGIPPDSHESAKNWYFTSIIKASLWGPSPHLVDSSVSLEYYSGELPINVSDTGTATSRPKASVSCPRLEWGGNYKEDGVSLSFVILTGGLHPNPTNQLGLLRLTVCGRVVTNL